TGTLAKGPAPASPSAHEDGQPDRQGDSAAVPVTGPGQPLAVPADGEVAVDTAGPGGTRPVTVHSRPAREAHQTSQPPARARHAAGPAAGGPGPARDGQPAPRGDPPAPATRPGQLWPPSGAQPIDLDELYDRLTALGYTYGPAFHGLKAAWWHGGGLLAEVT